PAYMKTLHDAGMRGLFIQQAENVGYSFLMSQLELYLTLKLADDPTLDGNALMDEFFTRYYGEASPMMKQLYAEMEKVKFDISNYPEAVQRGDKYNLLSREIAYKYLVTPERAERWGKLMDTALASATGAYKERVQRYKTEVWDRMMAARAKYLAQGPSQAKQATPNIPAIVSAIEEKFEDAASLQKWTLGDPGKMELAGASVAPFEGKDCLKLVPENMVKDKKRQVLCSKQKITASQDTTLTVSCAVRGDGQDQSGFFILDCFDASGKLLKSIWKPLTVTNEWKTVKYEILLDEKATGAGLATIGLRIGCYGEGAFYIDDINVSKKL
ncbi:MAG: DUF4838 domain-containing protein, partial [Deltaproteobacteria bacterium]